jgi:hypothetical protein
MWAAWIVNRFMLDNKKKHARGGSLLLDIADWMRCNKSRTELSIISNI